MIDATETTKKFKCKAIEKVTKSKIAQIIIDGSADDIINLLLYYSLHSGKYDESYKLALMYSSHPKPEVRANAIRSFGYIAMNFKKIDSEIVYPILKRAIKDENKFVRETTIEAKDDICFFLKKRWKLD